MQVFRSGSILAAVLLAAACPATAQQPAANSYKIGYVNTERMTRDSRASQKAAESLGADIQKREKEIAAGPAADIARRSAALADEFNQRRDDELKRFLARANGIIRRIAEAGKMDIVFLDATYASTRIDITDQVIRALDAGK